MNLRQLFLTLLVQQLYPTWASPHLYRNICKPEFDKLEECASLTAQYSTDKGKIAIKKKDCIINPQFTDSILTRILNGTEISAQHIPLSFKSPIKQVIFHVPSTWRELKEYPFTSSTKEHFYCDHEEKETRKIPPCDYFFSSTDGKFLVNSISEREFTDFSKDLNDYAEHMETNPGSKLVRVVGMFKVASMYFAIYVAPFDGGIPEDNLAFEFSYRDFGHTEYSDEQRQGFLPLGERHWNFWSLGKPFNISMEENIQFRKALQKDVTYLKDSSYVNYRILILIPMTSKSNLKFKGLNIFGKRDQILPVGISITHFFHRSRKSWKPPLYAEGFEKTIRNGVVKF